MILSSLNLQNFRSFKKKKFEFSKNTTLIIGPNASGKTNILEAIYLLATGKSFRASREQEFIKYDQEVAWAAGVILDGKMRSAELEITLTHGEVQGKRTRTKLYKVNEVGKMWRDFAGILKCVLFRPEDIDLILGSPSIRRNYLNSVLEQTDWKYRVCNLAYKKGLRQRNKLLDRIKEEKGNKFQLTFWNQLLIKNGQIITQKREEMIDFFNQCFDLVEIFYDKSVVSEKRLEKYAQAELALGSTLVGPHRDDIEFRMKNLELRTKRNLALYGSRGEQRMAVLNLKLAELEFITRQTRQKPVLLLDDIFSELDKGNKALVLKIIDDCQVIISGTEIIKDIKKVDNCFIERLY